MLKKNVFLVSAAVLIFSLFTACSGERGALDHQVVGVSQRSLPGIVVAIKEVKVSSDVGNKAVVGGGAGAILGSVIGGKNKLLGAGIGGALGAAGGYAIGKSMDSKKRFLEIQVRTDTGQIYTVVQQLLMGEIVVVGQRVMIILSDGNAKARIVPYTG